MTTATIRLDDDLKARVAGYLVVKDKKARFIVVAADRDYDPAIAYARGEGIDVMRVADLPVEIPTSWHAGAPRTGEATSKVMPPRATAPMRGRQS